MNLPLSPDSQLRRNGFIRKLTWWVLAFPAVLSVVLIRRNGYWLDFTHVISGSLWTGTDIFMGFIFGPILRRLDPPQRKAVIDWLTPKTRMYIPVLAITTGLSGWYLATWSHLDAPYNPDRPWVFSALLVLSILTIQGFGILLPNSARTYRELQKSSPDSRNSPGLHHFGYGTFGGGIKERNEP